jgi:hypothetical protein
VRPSPRPPSSPRPSPPALHRWPRPPSSALRSPLGAVVAAASEQPHPPEPRRSSVLARRRRWLGEAGSVSARSPTTLARSRDELAGAMAEQDSAFSDVAIEIDALDVFGNTAVAEFRVTSRRTEPFVVGGAAARWFRKSLPGGGAASHAPPSGRAPFQQVLRPAAARGSRQSQTKPPFPALRSSASHADRSSRIGRNARTRAPWYRSRASSMLCSINVEGTSGYRWRTRAARSARPRGVRGPSSGSCCGAGGGASSDVRASGRCSLDDIEITSVRPRVGDGRRRRRRRPSRRWRPRPAAR